MRVLILAYACEPGKGGEGEIGWALANRLAGAHQVWVLTRSNNHPALAAANRNPDLKLLYYDLPRLFTALKGRGKKNFLLYYYLWQLGSAAAIRRFDRQYGFDVIHHLTGGMDWMPSGAAFQKKPFVWGPVGSENTHPLIRRQMPWRARLKDTTRSALRFCLRNLDPAVRRTRARADVILSHTPGNFPAGLQNKVVPFVQTGIEPAPRMALRKSKPQRGRVIRIIYAGEFVDWKGALLAVRAFAAFHAAYPQSRLTMVGAGNQETAIRKVITRNGLDAAVTLTGKLPMETLLGELNRADVFLYPSYHHGLATILLQAMLTGLPTVCLEGDAIGRAVGQEAGITLPPPHSGDAARVLAQALLTLAGDEDLRQLKAKVAMDLALNRYNYDAITARHSDVYCSLLAQSGTAAGSV
ncbi:glycosyltransferase family 4 protein [Leisingera sp. MMG026]|uniref:glycosyltransferase family 4 protein n=1 Tax=Leisingera sp. MMG026 TaxID=2909982 RepID=UPI001F29B6B0|nr:glycosyltransferase family 4 protein [Leisingera sp. MMG026]MCF6431198.1 glycosyltransferase family 4 protein [Leisingera sp. MMG026]